MGYIKDLNEVIQIQRFQIELRKTFTERNQIESLSKEIGENIEYYSKEFKEKTEEYTILQLWTIFGNYSPAPIKPPDLYKKGKKC